MATAMRTIAESLIASGMATAETIVACSPAEVDEVRSDMGVDQLPGQYEDFLLVMGRRAGELLMGTDFYYPTILGLAEDGRQLLAENHAMNLLTPSSVIIGMHQGYQLYWMESGQPSGRVRWYTEGQQSVLRTWPTLLDFLVEQMQEERRLLGR